MNKLRGHIQHILLAFSMLAGSALYSQDKSKDKGTDKDEFSMRNYKLEPNDRLILEVNHTSWLGYPGNIKTVLPSIGVNFSLMFDKALGNSNFTIGYGIGLFSHNFHSNADFLYVRDSVGNNLTTKLEPYNRPVSLNRYAEKILEIPVELRFRTKTDRQLKIHVGGKIGYVVNDFRSIKDNDGKIRVYNIKNVNHLRYGLNFRIGFEQIALCATYYLSEVFEKDKGPAGIHPFAFGIAIIPY
jgi:hypothetical protein